MYYPKTIKKDPFHNWKEIEKYRDNNKGRLPTEQAKGTKKVPTLDITKKVNQDPIRKREDN